MEKGPRLNTPHPLAWWAWAIGIGIAANGTTNPLLLVLIALATVIVVLARRSAAPWARSVRAYLTVAAVVIAIRLVFQILIGASGGDIVLFRLPEVPLPAWAAGIRLGGAVTAEAVVATTYGALRLAVLLLCVGAANSLASPRQALRSVPAALYEVSVAVVVALNVAPQLIESGQRVRRARRLRGASGTGLAALGPIAMAVLGDAIERSVALAAGMEARGFGRTAAAPARGATALLITSAMIAALGGFLLLGTDLSGWALLLLVLGTLGVVVGLRRAGQRLAVTRYRRHQWQRRDSAVAASGLLAATVVLAVSGLDPASLSPWWAQLLQPAAFAPSTYPLEWPQLSVPIIAVVALTLAPLALTTTRVSDAPDAARTDHRVRALRPEPEPA